MKKTYIQPTINVVVVGVKLLLAASSETKTMNLFGGTNDGTVDGGSAMSSSFSGGDDGEDW